MSSGGSYTTRTNAISFENVKIHSDFWTERIRTCQANTLPAIYVQLKKTGRWDSLKLKWKPDQPNKPHRFWDSDVAKWLEAACYSLVHEPSEILNKLVEDAVDLIRGAQQEDGYINTYFTVVEPGKRWTNIAWSHEMYCAGHLLEAAIAHYIYSGSYRLLSPILKYVEHIGTVFGQEETKKKGYPGHEELELALIKAYEVIGDVSLLRLARYFIEERGCKRPEGHYFDLEAKARGESPQVGPGRGSPYSYQQADRQIRHQISIEGHSVRAMYWLTGAAGVTRLDQDEGLFEAIQRLWTSTTQRKMYVTGGLGAVPEWEGFGPDYFLPNETGYLETCAALGLIFFSHQMILSNAVNMEYANVMELALYNAALVGMSLDGRSFFYDNPLATVGKYLSRSPWFEVSCCPPNVARFLNSIGNFIYSIGIDNTLYIHQYISSTILKNGQVVAEMQSDMPWDGNTKISIRGSDSNIPFQICLRIPPGSIEFIIYSSSPCTQSIKSDHVMLLLGGDDHGRGTDIYVSFSFKPRLIFPHELNLDNRGCVVIARGPIIYCAETIDNEHIHDLRAIRIPSDAEFEEVLDKEKFAEWKMEIIILRTMVDIIGKDQSEKNQRVSLALIPYFMWANRGKSDLRVWLPRAASMEDKY